MGTIISEGEKRVFVPAPAGTWQAVCFDFWDIGLQKVIYQGEQTIKHKGILGFEISETMPDGKMAGKRYRLFKKYTLSLHKKATLRQDLESWRGVSFSPEELKGFDVEKLVGQNCLLTVIHEKSVDGEKTIAKINAISKMLGGLTPLIAENPRSLPEWVSKLRAKAENAESFEAAASDSDEIPF